MKAITSWGYTSFAGQPEKASAAMETSASGTRIVPASAVQSAKALAPMLVRLSGRVRPVMAVLP